MSSPFPRRLVQSALLALAVTLCLPALAAADAPDVTSATGKVVAQDATSVTVEISGTWAWTTHHSDCNTDRAGAGFAIDWGDNNGNHVTTLNGDSIDVGVLTSTLLNNQDNAVHTESGATGLTGFTCGTYKPALGYNTGTFTGLTHKYPANSAIPQICALAYDVHGKNGVASGAKDVTAGGSGHNSDNSAEKNASTPGGNQCFTIVLPKHPTLTTNAGSDKPVGSTLTDSAPLSGASTNPAATGTITFKLYGPNDASCTGPVIATSTKTVNGNGNYTSNPSGAINVAGTYRWIANYGGDANNAATTNGCNGDNENVGVGQVTPRVTTDAGSAVSVGTAMHDTATLSGGVNPTGTISFKLYGPDDANCTGPVISTSSRNVTANGVYTSDNFTPTAGGTYRWIANYSGDANNAATTNGCNGDNENVFVNKLQPSVTTNAGNAVTLGSPLHGTATLTGATANATGTITFTLYGPDDASCAVSIFTTTKTVNGNANYVSADFTPTAAGTYRWVANYGGDGANASTSNGCNGANENVVVNKASPAVTTNAGNPVPLGTAIKDSATLSGGQNPQGQITFKLYGPNDANCSTVIFTSVKTVAGNDVYQSDSFTPTAAGTYRWIANYSGDSNNNVTSNGCNGQNENVEVGKSGPTVATNAGPDVILGATLQDSATLAGGTNPTGKITFDLYGPNDGTCATSIFHSETTVTNGNGTYQSTGFKPTTPGTYRWVANYTGDANNTATTNACNGTNENVVVSANSAIHIVKSGPASALSGDDVQFNLAVTNPGDQPLSNVTVTDARCDAVGPTLVSKTNGDQDNVLEPGELWTYTCTAHTTAGATLLHNVATACGTPPVGGQVCDDSPKDVPLRNPDISIDKAGPATITAGGTINYTLDVSNTGDQRFAESKVVVTDPKCDATPTLSSKNNDLTPSFLNPGETWRYVCSHVTKTTDTGTYHNVGLVTGTDEAGDVVNDDDDADTVINPPPGCTVNCSPPCTVNCGGGSSPNPKIAVVKVGPVSALAGSDLTFQLTVTNPGTEPLSAVTVTDARCDALPPTLLNNNGDKTPDTLNPGDTWIYTCTSHTAAGDTTLHNTVTTTGKPPSGPPVSANGSADVPLVAPAQQVEPLLPGVSRLRGPSGCIAARAQVLRVSGSRVARGAVFLHRGHHRPPPPPHT